jgi:hypothetical protein
MTSIIKIDSPETLYDIFGGDEDNKDGFYKDAKIQLALNGFYAWQIGALRQAHLENGVSGIKKIWDDVQQLEIDAFRELHQTHIEFRDENAAILEQPVSAPAP